MFKRTIGQTILGKLYKALLDLGIIMDDDILKYNGQCPKLMYILAILIKLLRQKLSLTITLRCFQDTLSGPRVDKLLYLAIELLNSSTENSIQIIIGLVGILSKILILI